MSLHTTCIQQLPSQNAILSVYQIFRPIQVAPKTLQRNTTILKFKIKTNTPILWNLVPQMRLQ